MRQGDNTVKRRDSIEVIRGRRLARSSDNRSRSCFPLFFPSLLVLTYTMAAQTSGSRLSCNITLSRGSLRRSRGVEEAPEDAGGPRNPRDRRDA